MYKKCDYLYTCAAMRISFQLMSTLIEHSFLNAEKPECISAHALRAQARLILSTGQTVG